MSYGRVCKTHGQWCPDGVCKWCVPSPEPLDPYIPAEVARPCENPPPPNIWSSASMLNGWSAQ
jgi:hypothetical protein